MLNIDPTEAPKDALRHGFILLPRFTLLPFAGFVDALRLAADEGDQSRQIRCQWTVMGAGLEEVEDSTWTTPEAALADADAWARRFDRESARSRVEDVEEVLLVGGSTLLPGVFGLGNVLTGKGNIKESRKNAIEIIEKVVAAYLGVGDAPVSHGAPGVELRGLLERAHRLVVVEGVDPVQSLVEVTLRFVRVGRDTAAVRSHAGEQLRFRFGNRGLGGAGLDGLERSERGHDEQGDAERGGELQGRRLFGGAAREQVVDPRAPDVPELGRLDEGLARRQPKAPRPRLEQAAVEQASSNQLSLFVSDPCKQKEADPLQEALAEIDPDSLTPREALEQLYRLKEISGD